MSIVMDLSGTEDNVVYEVSDHPRTYSNPPSVPLNLVLKVLLFITEFPYLILWAYFGYWASITVLTAGENDIKVWLSAAVASILVGLALNASAYRYIVKPRGRRRSVVLEESRLEEVVSSEIEICASPLASPNNDEQRVKRLIYRFPRMFHPNKNEEKNGCLGNSGLLSLSQLASKLPGSFDWCFDYGTIVRFFIIPFGVSSLSGMTTDPNKFFLVFPKDQRRLFLVFLVPWCLTISLFMLRLVLLKSIKAKWEWKIIFLNGCLTM